MAFKRMSDMDLSGQRVVIREDFNVPLMDGQITNDARIQAALPTIRMALAQNAAVILLSHLGRPTEGEFDDKFSLGPVAVRLSALLGQDVALCDGWLDGVDVQPGQCVLCENVRFMPGEKKNNSELAQKMAALGDVFVMDAFATAHRAQASTSGISQFIATACAGPLLCAELDALEKALQQPEKPVLAIVGGAKVSTKLEVLGALLEKTDMLLVGGGIANTFIAASGYAVGKSLYEPDLLDDAKTILAQAKERGVTMPLPTDVIVARTFAADATAETKLIAEVAEDDLILDIGPQTAAHYDELIQLAQTIIWNGPVGVFEMAPFAAGTQALSDSIAKSSAFSLAGGGDTLAAIDKFNIRDKISYISTGGGAFLEFVEGKALPAVEALC